ILYTAFLLCVHLLFSLLPNTSPPTTYTLSLHDALPISPGRGPQEACRGCDHERANRFEDEVEFDPQASHTSIVAGAHRVARGSWCTTETMRAASGVMARWSSSTVKATTMIPMSAQTTTSWA